METRLKHIPDRWYFFRLLPLLSRLPPSLSFRFARLAGSHFFRAHKINRQEVLRNLETVFGSGSETVSRIRPIARISFETMAFEDLEAYYFRSWSAVDVERLIRFEDLRHLDAALAEGHGALLCTGHQAGIGAALVALGIKGYPVTHVAREFADEASFPSAFREYATKKVRWMNQHLVRPLIHVHPDPSQRRVASASAVLEIYRSLAANHLVSMALDVVPEMVDETEQVVFLGRQARFASSIVRLAHLCQVPVIPYFPVRDPERPYHQEIRILPPVPLTGNRQRDLQQCVLRLEEIIREHPGQWWSWDSLAHFWTVERGPDRTAARNEESISSTGR